MGFCVKELFKDVNQSEISFLNKALKLHVTRYSANPEATIGKRTLPGEKWPSNEWPDATKTLACALLTLHRKDVDPKEILASQIFYPGEKAWGLGVPYYDGTWEADAEKLLGFKLAFLDEPDEILSSDDKDFLPPLDSPELKRRNDFIDMLDEIK